MTCNKIRQIPGMTDEQYEKFIKLIRVLSRETRRWMEEVKEMDMSRWYGDMNCPYYCEAFGMMRTLEILGYGKMGSVNMPTEGGEFNLRNWFENVYREIAIETGYDEDHWKKVGV